MAEIIVSTVVTVLNEKISGELMNLARSERIDYQLKKLKDDLSLIEAVFADAGEKLRDTSGKLWLHELHDVAYDIHDVLDDLATKPMWSKLNQESSPSTRMDMISTKLDEIRIKLAALINQKMDLRRQGLEENVVMHIQSQPQVDEFRIIGREGDKEALIGKLLGDEACNGNNYSVVSIVGMGGIGKTTLAQLLYNDHRVKHHFDLMAWVCVSEEFDVFSISKAILQAIAGAQDTNLATLDLLHAALRENLSKKRFLLVLDDVWNEDRQKWELFKIPFVVGAAGSKVIVTTRKNTIASVMDSVEVYHVNLLSHEEALSLLAQNALGEHDFEQHPKLKSHAESIVKQCDGLPLALTTIGRLMRGRSDESEWEELLNSFIRDQPYEFKILRALRLSYYDLPSHIQQLFAYCSLIPKDYEFSKNELVLLWIAEGFLSKSNRHKSMETSGHECFEELMTRSFFQHSMDDKSRYTMHALMSDLAISVAGEFFFMLDDDNMHAYDAIQASEKLRHFSFTGRGHGVPRMFEDLHKARRIRTFLTMQVDKWKNISFDLDELLPRLPFLRVLSLAHSGIRKIPQSIGDLKHLRYLNFSHTAITCLPEQVSDLYYLQILLLSGCVMLNSLAVSFAKLNNLRHLDISDTPNLKKMPLEIGGLLSLQTLSRAIVEGPNDGFKISELKDLSGLQGQISIEGLHNVTNAGQAKDANLNQKESLDELVLQWSEVFDDSRNATTEYNVLKVLRSQHLRKMEIKFYGGKEFPSWSESPSFDKLTELTLRGCRSCKHLSTLGRLRSLEVLECYDLECWENWFVSGADKDGTVTLFPRLRRIYVERCPKLAEVSIALPALEEFKFYDMKGFEIWSTGGGDNDGAATLFPRLRRIYVERCPKLAVVLVPLPLLEELEFYDIEDLEIKSTGGSDNDGAATSFPHLRRISIKHCPKIAEVSTPLPSLEELEFYDMKGLEKWSTVGGDKDGAATSCPNLHQISIEGCPKLAEVSVGSMPSLQVLNVHGCFQAAVRSLISVSQSILTLNISDIEGPIQLDQEDLKHLKAVEDVSIGYCNELRYLWESESEACKFLVNLRKLDVRRCRNLVSLGENKEDLLGVGMKSIEEVSFRDCNKLESYNCPNTVERLEIIDCCSMTSLTFFSPVQSSLKFLIISNCNNLKSFPHLHLQCFTSLELLSVKTCPGMDSSFPCGLWPPNLTNLSIGELKKPMAEWRHQNYPTSLVELTLYGENSGVVSFGVESNINAKSASSMFLLPSSLKSLSIRDFKDVESLADVLEQLTSLEQLHIWRCPKLKDLPETTSALRVQQYTVIDSWADRLD